MDTRTMVLRLTQEGLKPSEIATRLGVGRSAVSNHLRALRIEGKISDSKPTVAASNVGAPRKHGAQPGNRNALRHGGSEKIFYDTLTPEERALLPGITTDLKSQLELEIRLITIRERRMMQRIANLADVPFTVVEKAMERRREEEGAGKGVDDLDEGEEPESWLYSENTKQLATLGQIQIIEEALTRVQEKKTKILELKHKVESGDPPNPGDFDAYVAALNETAAEVWADENPDSL